MSVGHRLEDWELAETSLYDLYHALGANDTPYLFGQPIRLDTDHDWPAAGGMSLDRRTVYIDRTLYQEAMDGAFAATGLSGEQIVHCWLQHERVETAIVCGDNSIDDYIPAHRRALAAEHEVYRIFGADPAQVEEAVWPSLVACYKRPIKNPPLDAWCGVYHDDPGQEEQRILEELIGHGVIDARKRSKYEVSYGIRGHRCDQCRNRDDQLYDQGPLFGCIITSGLVRDDRTCDFWLPEDADAGLEDKGVKLGQATVDYTDKGHKPELCASCVHFQGEASCEIVRGPIASGGWCRLWSK